MTISPVGGAMGRWRARNMDSTKPNLPDRDGLVLWRGATFWASGRVRWEQVVSDESGHVDLFFRGAGEAEWSALSDLSQFSRHRPWYVGVLLGAVRDTATRAPRFPMPNAATSIVRHVAAHTGVEMGEERISMIVGAVSRDLEGAISAAVAAEREACVRVMKELLRAALDDDSVPAEATVDSIVDRAIRNRS